MILLFDLDDTLVDSRSAYVYGMKKVGLSENDSSYLKGREAVKKMLPSGAPSARSRFLYFKQMLQMRGEYTPQRHLEICHAYENGVVEYVGKQWQNLGRSDFFLDLKKHFPKIGIVTNETTRMQILKVMAFDPNFEIFDYIVTSEEAGCEKPQEKIFQLAFDHFKAPLKEFVMIGDSFKNDIEPATKLGITAIKTVEFFDDGMGSGTFPTISNLMELPKLLNSK